MLMLTAYVLNSDGLLERTNNYDPEDAGFEKWLCDELYLQAHDGRVILDLHGRIYAIDPVHHIEPVLLHDYTDEIDDSLAFPRG